MMEPPPFAPGYDDFDALMAFSNAWARDHGYAMAIQRRTNRDKAGNYRRVDLYCDRGGKITASRSTGIREKSTSRKTGCAFSIKVNLIDDLWVPTVLEAAHNHGPSLDAASHPIHRRKTWTQQQKEEVRSHFKSTLGSARDIASIMSSKYPQQLWPRVDIRNEITKARDESLAGYTPTQALIRAFEERSIKHFYRQHQGHITAILWTLP